MKKILVIQGGGRAKGNTAQLVNSFVAGVEESGHSVEVISLLKNEVRGCLGCNACRKSLRYIAGEHIPYRPVIRLE